MKQKTNYLFPLAIIGLFFFSIGFALGINSYLMPVLEKSMHISAHLWCSFKSVACSDFHTVPLVRYSCNPLY